jgi:hypothetical protein
MLLMTLMVVAAVAAGSLLLALASDAFAYELSRVAERAFDAVEYRQALRAAARKAHTPEARIVRGAGQHARAGLSW